MFSKANLSAFSGQDHYMTGKKQDGAKLGFKRTFEATEQINETFSKPD